jgi:hypothetical protein
MAKTEERDCDFCQKTFSLPKRQTEKEVSNEINMFWVFLHRQLHLENPQIKWEVKTDVVSCCSACFKERDTKIDESNAQNSVGDTAGCTFAIVPWIFVVFAMGMTIKDAIQGRARNFFSLNFAFLCAGVFLSIIFFFIGKYTVRLFTGTKGVPHLSIDTTLEEVPRIRDLFRDGWEKCAFPPGVEGGIVGEMFWSDSFGNYETDLPPIVVPG